MDRSKTLISGLGQCGGIIADTFKICDARYTPLFINSSIGDSKGLKYANDNNRFLYSGADGSGSDRDKGLEYIGIDKARLITFLNKYKDFKYMIVTWGMSGGTGSGTIIEFVKNVKLIYPNMLINLVGVMPSLNEDNLRLKNFLDCCNDLKEIANMVNDIKFINNEKGNNYAEINYKAVKDINMEYAMLGHSKIGSIDINNLENVATSAGYGVVLELKDGFKSIEDAISKAIEDSVFAIPQNLDCTYGAINFKENKSYDIEDVKELITSDETMYTTTNNDKYNIIALGGCEMPYNEIKDVEDELKERDLRKPKNRRDIGFNFNSSISAKREIGNNRKKDTENVEVKKDYLDDDDIDALFGNTDFFTKF